MERETPSNQLENIQIQYHYIAYMELENQFSKSFKILKSFRIA